MGMIMEEFNDLLDAWKDYLRYHLYSKPLRRLKRVMPGAERLVLLLFFLFLMVISLSWLIGNMAFAQEKLSLSEATWLVTLGSFFPWADRKSTRLNSSHSQI